MLENDHVYGSACQSLRTVLEPSAASATRALSSLNPLLRRSMRRRQPWWSHDKKRVSACCARLLRALTGSAVSSAYGQLAQKGAEDTRHQNGIHSVEALRAEKMLEARRHWVLTRSGRRCWTPTSTPTVLLR